MPRLRYPTAPHHVDQTGTEFRLLQRAYEAGYTFLRYDGFSTYQPATTNAAPLTVASLEPDARLAADLAAAAAQLH